MFVDLDWPLNASSLLSASAELLVVKITLLNFSRNSGQPLYPLQHDGVIDHSIGEYRHLQLSWIRMADTLNTRFTNSLYYKIIAATDAVLKYFLRLLLRLSLQSIRMHRTSWRHLSSLWRFHRDVVCITLLVVLSSLYRPKSLNFVDAFNCEMPNERCRFWPTL